MHYSLFLPYNNIVTTKEIKMTQPKFFKKRKVEESLSQSSPPLPAETNPLVTQQQANTIGAQTAIQSIPGHFQKVTKATSAPEQEDGVTHNHKRSNSATKRKQIPKAPQTQNTSHQVQDPQHESSHSVAGEVNEITTEQVNCRQQTPKHGFQPNKKRRRHQYRLCS